MSLRMGVFSVRSLVGIALALAVAPPALNGQENAANPAAPAASAAPAVPTIDRLQGSATPESGLARTKTQQRMELPNSSGQYWVEYDLRPYTQGLKNVDRPQQAVIDWILRETGSDVWFNEPMGILSADRTTLRVYHNAGMHQVVAQVYERFVNGSQEPQVFGLRQISIGNTNWRSKALPLMRSADARTPGLQAWLMTKESAAIFGAQLRQRQDTREIQAVDLTMVQGQSQTLEQLRARTYLEEYVPNTISQWPPLTPKYAEIQEGYRMVFSPLLSLDGRTIDAMLKCDIDQVERLTPVAIDAPGAGGRLQVEVPQLVSWRLHERFRWPTDHVLVLSCGIIAAPTGAVQNSLLGGGGTSFLGMNRILPASMAGQRSDALLIIEYKGTSANQLTPAGPMPTNPAGNGATVPNLGFNPGGAYQGR